MDGVTSAAAIATIIQVGAQVLQICYQYIAAVHDAPKDIRRVVSEVGSLNVVLQELEFLIKKISGNDDDDASSSQHSALLKSFIAANGPFQTCESALEELKKILGSSRRWKPGRRLMWPMEDKDVRRLLSVVEQQKITFILALSIDDTRIGHGVEEKLDEATRLLKEITLKDTTGQILAWLSPMEPYEAHKAARLKHEHTPTTGTWLINSDKFESLLKRPSEVLWLHGIMGSGKTVLCSLMIEQVLAHCELAAKYTCIYYYIDSNDIRKQTVSALLRSLIVQLIDEEDSLQEIKAARDKHGNGREQPSNATLLSLFLSLAGKYEKMYIVVDALDECLDAQEMLDFIRKIRDKSPEHLSMILTSQTTWRNAQDLDQLASLDIRITDDVIMPDIQVYILNRIQHNPRMEQLPKPTKDNIITRLAQGAEGMFRWVACQLDSLENTRNLSALMAALESLPQGLDKTYERILERIMKEDFHEALAALKWLTCSLRPLKLKELAEAIVVKIGLDPLRTADRFFNAWELVEICSSLVVIMGPNHAPSVEGGKDEAEIEIQLAHSSVRQYLFSQRLQEGPCSMFFVPEMSTHTYLGQTCVAYLNLLKHVRALGPQIYTLFPLTRYAAEYWHQHLRMDTESPYDDVALEVLAHFFCSDQHHAFLNWLRIYDPDKSIREDFSRTIKDVASPMYYASLVGCLPAVKLLMQGHADINEHGGRQGSPLQAALSNNHERVVHLLLESGAKPGGAQGLYGTALLAAVWQGNYETVDELLTKGADPNARGDEVGQSPEGQGSQPRGYQVLVSRAPDGEYKVLTEGGIYDDVYRLLWQLGRTDVIRVVLGQGSDTRRGAGFEEQAGTAIHYAAMLGHESIVDLLLKHGAEVNAKGGTYSYALQAAAAFGFETLVTSLLDSGADIDAKGGLHGSALQAAISSKSDSIVATLLDRGADVNVQGGLQGSVLQAAVAVQNPSLVETLLEKGADPNAVIGDPAGLLAAIAGTRDSDAPYGKWGEGEQWAYALQSAARKGLEDIVLLLLDYGANANAQGGKYGTALQAAASKGYTSVVKLLLDRGADIELQGGKYGSAIQAGAASGNAKTLKLLIARGADLNVEGGKYNTALEAASMQGSFECVKMLLDNGFYIIASGVHSQCLASDLIRTDSNALPQLCLLDAVLARREGRAFGFGHGRASRQAGEAGGGGTIEEVTRAQ